MCKGLNEVLTSARAAVASLDVAALTGSQASTLFETGAELEKLGASLKVLVAPKIAESETWARAGHRSPEEWMARTSGTSVGVAKATVETGKRLEQLPDTASAVKSGALSLAQAAAVAEAAAADPQSEERLLAAAGTEGLKGLQQQARRVVLDSRGSVEERYERQRKLRDFSSWTDDEGMTAGKFRLTPEVGAAVINKIRREQDRIYRQAYKEGRRESPENYAADAFAALVTGEGLIGTKNPKGSEVVVVVSRDALLRGEVDRDADELCEVPGFGAVPVSLAREMLPDAFLKGVVVDGTRVTHVKHFGRRRSAEIDTALLVRTLLEQGDVCCDFEGCGRKDIEWDHTLDFAKIRETTEENLRPLCRFHHREKTAGRLIREGGRWTRAQSGSERSPP